MDFLENIVIGYYIRESHQGFGAALFGGLLLIIAVLLFRSAPPRSLAKGLTLPLLLVGLIMGLGGLADGYSSRSAIPRKIELFRKSPKAFFDREVPQVERTHNAWFMIRIIWGTFTVLGIGLLCFVRKEYWMGVGLGLLILSIGGHVEEAISKNFNERYYLDVVAEAGKY
jgi:UDP-N-acetylmuramyl pentapeptide phosphotransferase/UDP-N-acetylglucosamine-1-phosphate transferase